MKVNTKLPQPSEKLLKRFHTWNEEVEYKTLDKGDIFLSKKGWKEAYACDSKHMYIVMQQNRISHSDYVESQDIKVGDKVRLVSVKEEDVSEDFNGWRSEWREEMMDGWFDKGESTFEVMNVEPDYGYQLKSGTDTFYFPAFVCQKVEKDLVPHEVLEEESIKLNVGGFDALILDSDGFVYKGERISDAGVAMELSIPVLSDIKFVNTP